MRLSLFLVILLASSGCDLLKGGKKDDTQAASSSSTTSASSGTAAATTAKTPDTAGTQEQPGAKKPATSGCAFPEDSTIDHDVTITKGCSLVAKHRIDIQEGSTFTIEEGVKIAWDTDTYLWVRYGKLVIKGTQDQPVTFTSANSSPAAGDWVGIGFEEKTAAGTSIDHLIMEYTGSRSSSGHAAVELEDMRNGGRISITNSVFRSGAQFGLVAGDNGTFAKFENNMFRDNKSGSLNVVAEVLGSVGRGNTFNQPIHVKRSDVDTTTTWPPFDVPVIVDGDINIKSDSSVPTLTIADKTIVKLGQDVMIDTGDGNPGAIVAKNVLFTSASPSPSPGDYSGIFIHSKSNGTDIENCTFEYFGNGSHSAHGAITFESTNLKDVGGVTIANNTFRKGKWNGIYTDDGDCAASKGNKGDGVPACGKNH